jgi:hypothetical protein
MLLQYIIAGTKERFEGRMLPHPPPKLHPLALWIVALPLEALARSKRPCELGGTSGPFPPAVAMVVAVVTPDVFCAKATEKCNKNTKLICL